MVRTAPSTAQLTGKAPTRAVWARGAGVCRVLAAGIVGALVLASSGSAQDPTPGAPLATRWEAPAGAPDIGSRFGAIVQDRRGLLYLAGTAGVVELDGARWRPIPLVGGGAAVSLAADRDGRVWVGGTRDLGFLSPDGSGNLIHVSLRPEIDATGVDLGVVHTTLAAADGAVWFVGRRGVALARAGRVEAWPSATRVEAATVAGDGLLLLTSDRQLLHATASGFDPLAATVPSTAIGLVAGDPALLLSPTSLQVVGQREPLGLELTTVLASSGGARAACRLSDGGVAIATSRGAVVLVEADGSLRQRIDLRPEVGSGPILALAEDAEGGLWLALEQHLVRLEIHVPLTRWGPADGLTGLPTSVLPTTAGMWVATNRGVLRFRADPLGRGAFELVPGLEGDCRDLATVGGALVAACADGLRTAATGAETLLSSEAFVLAGDPTRRGTLWAGLVDGIARLTRSAEGAWLVERLEGWTDATYGLAVDDAGSLLALSDHGLARLEPGPPLIHTPLLGSVEATGLNIQRLATRGVVAFGSHGLRRWDPAGGSFVHDPRFASGDARWVGAVAEAEDGSLWLTTPFGVVAAGATGPATLRLATSGRFDPAAVTTLVPSGRTLWIAAGDSLLRLWTTAALRPRTPPTALWRRITTANGRRMLSAGAFRDGRGMVSTQQGPGDVPTLGPGPVDLEVEVAAARWDAPAGLQHRFRLLGSSDAEWGSWGNQPSKDVGGLGPGSWRIEAQARDAAGATSEVIAYRFVVAPRWFETWWARIAAAASGLVALGGAVLGGERWARERAHREAERERRQRELLDARALHQSMLPTEVPTIAGFDIAVEHRTASEVGGDYWDAFPQPDGRLFLAVGDATGHGLAAGLMVAATRTALLTVEPGDLATLLRRLDRVLRRVVTNRRHHMALALAEMGRTPHGYRIEVAGAGLPPAYILRVDGRVDEISCSGLPLGANLRREDRSVAIELAQGDVVLFATDGLVERAVPGGGQLGWEALGAILTDIAARLRRNPKGLSARQVLELLLTAWDERCAGHAADDDVTVVVVRCTDGSQPSGDATLANRSSDLRPALEKS